MSEERAVVKTHLPEVLLDEESGRSETFLMPQPDPPPDEPFVDGERLIEQSMPALLNDIGICFKGPPGCGKTSLAQVLAAHHYKAPIYTLQGHSEQESYDFLCRQRLSANPDERLVASPLIAAMVHGGVFFYDEIGKAPERALSLLASVLDKRKRLDIDQAKLKLKAHPRFRFIATINPKDRELSDFIKTRLRATIHVNLPSAQHLRRIVAAHFGNSSYSTLLEAFKDWAADKKNIAPRDAIALIQWADGKRQFEGRSTLTRHEAARLIEEAAAIILEGV